MLPIMLNTFPSVMIIYLSYFLSFLAAAEMDPSISNSCASNMSSSSSHLAGENVSRLVSEGFDYFCLTSQWMQYGSENY